MAGGVGGGPRAPDTKAARAPPTAIDSTVQSIKEVVGGHSEADILDALRESNMDPNETAQKLLNQDPFHEVKRKRDKKRESAVQKNCTETTAQGEHGTQRTKPHTQRVEIDQRRAHNQGQTYGPTREFRVVRDNRHNAVENGAVQHKVSTYMQASDRSGVVVQSDRNRPPPTTSEGQITHQSAKSSYNSDMHQMKRDVQGTAQRHARPYLKNSQNEHQYPNSDLPHASFNYKIAGGSVRPNRREAGVANAPRQYSGRPGSQLHGPNDSYHANIQRGNFASAGPSVRRPAFMPRNIQPNHRPAADTVSRGRSVGRSFGNQNHSRYHQGPANNQKVIQPAKEWKPKSTNKSSTNDTGNSGTNATSPLDSKAGNVNVLDVNSSCDKSSHANVHEMEHVIIPEHLRVPEYEQTRLRFGSFTPGSDSPEYEQTRIRFGSFSPGFDSDQLQTSTSSEPEQSEHVQESVQLVVQEDEFGTEHDEVDEPVGSQLTTISTSAAESSIPPSEDSEQMNGQEVEDDDGLGLVQSDTPLGAADDHNIQSTSSLTAFSAYGHEDPNMHPNNEAQLYGLVEPNVHQQMLASSSQGYTSVNPGADNAVQVFRMPESSVHSQVLPSASEALSSQLASSSPIAMSTQQQHMSQQQQAAQMYPPMHVQHYPNFMPYRHPLYSPVYVPPMAMPNYSANVPYPANGNNYLQMAGGGSHLTAGQVKYGVSQYKPVPAGNPSGYGNYTHPAGYTISSPGVIGAGVGVDDVNRMKYKDNNIYAPTPQVETSDIWIQNREIPTLQCPPYYNLSGMYHPQQPPSINSSENHVIEDLIVDHMIENGPLPSVVARGPIPELTFIYAAKAMLNQTQGNTSNPGITSTIQQVDLAKRLLLLKRQRDKELEDKKEALLAARREKQQKEAEEAVRKRHQQEEKKSLEVERKR
ncbi:hypothetical protein ZWY2020_049949 [Hordeum vulgare]|nr:hypothetical protein ZWY2020_049949 [Hordeum vulgare]